MLSLGMLLPYICSSFRCTSHSFISATVLASIVVLTTLPVSVFSSSLVIPTSPTEQAGLLCGIKTYSTPGAWSPLNYATVEATLVTPVGSLAFGLDSLLRTPAVA